MLISSLGWAGVELEAGDGSTVVLDALEDAAAVWAPLGDRAAGTPVPPTVPAQPGRAVAALVTHLHRDHADARAIAKALAPDAPVLEPLAGAGGPYEEAGLAQAEHELATLDVERRRMEPWETTTVGPFTITTLPAVDGSGDPQLSWAVEADGVRVLHAGDTMFHGFWWRMTLRCGPFDVALLPVNGAVLTLPHRQPSSPLPAAMTPGQAAIAARALGARLTVPIHAEGYEIDGVYAPAAQDPTQRFLDAADEQGVAARALELGETLTVHPAQQPAAAA
ncbi:MBL fold metallo-hydrolase [Conexibacter sp. SYSU D00693]|uniref:MBL fold metallo-hydrolase n=1 Tax=Conexibacter sp. SYSU D00693 TaxID=2812560 RepID=UPI00196ACF60|nr:MBL fold metallo-hydrolase [Conexibacter sp. SYSU D00693]